MKFVAPEMEIKMFSAEDVLTTSTATEEPSQADCPSELPLQP